MAKLLIIGAGAAGLFAAGSALSKGHSVVIIEHSDAPGKKLLLTGKGRCNLTNNCNAEEIMKNTRRNSRFMFSALNALPPAQVIELFETTLGLPLKTERGRRVFPVSDKAQDVLSALLKYAQGAKIVYDSVKSLIMANGICTGVKLKSGAEYKADGVLIATGGMSYQSTGSTGDGYALAKSAGHSIVPPEPSLVSLVEKGSTAKSMMGLSLKNVQLTLIENNKEVFKEQGEMLFTHFGLSGPLVLSASAHIRDVKSGCCKVLIDLKPALTFEQLDLRIQRDFILLSNCAVSNCLQKLLPAKMQAVMLKMWGVDESIKVNQITKQQRAELCRLLKEFPVEIKDKGDLAHAVITSGGVDVKQVNPKTMESKIVSGLFFAGEVLDVDAYTGGYNLQIAFSTAHAVAVNFN